MSGGISFVIKNNSLLRDEAKRLCVGLVLSVSSLALMGSAVAQNPKTVSYQYDELGRLIAVDYGDDESQTYEYDAAGNRTKVDVVASDTSSFSIGDASATEGQDLVFSIERTGSASLPALIDVAVSGGAVSSSDYSLSATSLSFAPGETQKNLTVTTNSDNVMEGSENIQLTLSTASAGVVIADAVGEGWIADSGSSSVNFAVNDASVTEGGNLTFTITKVGSTALTHSVNYATANNTTAPGDITQKSGTLTFAANENAKTVIVPTTADLYEEVNELIYLNLSNATGGATISDAQGSGTINNDDPKPTFSINDVTATEGGVLTFTVAKSSPSDRNYVVNYATQNGSATSGSDYTSKAGSVLLDWSKATETISIQTSDDAIDEVNENFKVNLTSVNYGSSFTDNQGIGTINDNDASPSFSVNDVSVTEGGNLSFVVTKSGSTNRSFNVNYATSNGTAQSNDYTAKSGTLTFAAGDTSKTVTVPTANDSVDEVNQTVKLTLSNVTGGATLSDSQGIGTINDNDASPSFSVNNVSATEGSNVSFTLSKSGATERSFTVNYATLNGSAAAGSDYTAKSGSVTFTGGQNSKTVSVSTANDTTDEVNENFKLNLTSVSGGASISDNQGIGTINDNDASPSFSVNDVSVSEGGTLNFTITKSGATTRSYNVNYATQHVGTNNSDFAPKSGTLNFAAGATTKTVSIPTINNSVEEANEQMNLNLSNATIAQNKRKREIERSAKTKRPAELAFRKR